MSLYVRRSWSAIAVSLVRAGLSPQPCAVRSDTALGQRLATKGGDALRVHETAPASFMPRQPRARGTAARACGARPAAGRTGRVPLSQIDKASLTLRRSVTLRGWRTTGPSHRTPVRSPSLAVPCGRGPRSFSRPPPMGGGMQLAESQDKDPWWTAPVHPRSPAAPAVDVAGAGIKLAAGVRKTRRRGHRVLDKEGEALGNCKR
jgi:hypothetical protein